MDQLPDPDDLGDVLAALRDAEPNDVVRLFAANPAFRAAERDELTTENNPYRRPVRPADLAWLDYSEPMAETECFHLTALLGHRMLRNVYDADRLLLPPHPDQANARDGADLYRPRTRMLAALARPVLERHLFHVIAEAGAGAASGRDALTDAVRQEAERRTAEPGSAFTTAAGTGHRREAVTFLLVQLASMRPCGDDVVARLMLAFGCGPGHTSAEALGRLRGDHEAAVQAWDDVLTAADMVAAPTAYWQLCLGTSLARGNHLLQLAAAPEHYATLLGAIVHDVIDRASTAAPLAALVEELFDRRIPVAPMPAPDRIASLLDDVVAPLHERFGPQIVEDVHRGLVQARHLRELWDKDVTEQLRWADSIEEYQERAAKIDRHLANEGIEVDLDTFVESSAETSTTHVHDDHRLVMIESGQMHFWNNITHKIQLVEGDKLLIPQSRLHGSTVLSGSCTYHQPIIPDQLLEQIR